MKWFISLLVFCSVLGTLMARDRISHPNVQVYSRTPGHFNVKNVLICHVNKFHPPEITIKILKNGVEIPNANQTILAFEDSWQYHLTKSVAFTPQSGEKYTCEVSHDGGPAKPYEWEPDQ